MQVPANPVVADDQIECASVKAEDRARVTEWQLLVSGYDKKVHAFTFGQPSTTWTAACLHAAPVNFLAECPDDCPTCVPCLIEFGHTVQARQSARRGAIADSVREQFAAFDGDKAFR